MILLFAVFSRNVLDFFDCVPHPNTAHVANLWRTHRVSVFRHIRCYEDQHQVLFPIAVTVAMALLIPPLFVFWQAWRLRRVVARVNAGSGGLFDRACETGSFVEGENNRLQRQYELTKIRSKWDFLWSDFNEQYAYWNGVILIKDVLFALSGILFSGALMQGSFSALVLSMYAVMVYE